MTLFIRRDKNGAIAGLFRRPQFPGQEKIEDETHPDILAYQNRPTPNTRPLLNPITGPPTIQQLTDKVNELVAILKERGIVQNEE